MPNGVPTISGELFRIRCVGNDLPCARGLDKAYGQYSAFAWTLEGSRGVVPLIESKIGAREADIDLKSASIRELGSNAFGWTHELTWTERVSTEHWGTDKNGAICCGHEVDNTETLHAFIRVNADGVGVEAVYVSKSAHDEYEPFLSGRQGLVLAGIDCETDLKWTPEGFARFTRKSHFPLEVLVRPENDGDGFVVVTTVKPEGTPREHRKDSLRMRDIGCGSNRFR